MQFILTAYDGTDPGAIDRRMAVREGHFGNVRKIKENNHFIWGGAILDDNGKMVGSTVIYEYPDRKSLDKMLETEPYVTGGVWENIKIHPFKLADV